MGQKLFIGIITAVLTIVFVSSLGFSMRAYELGNLHEVQIARIDSFMETQNKLNERLQKFLDDRLFKNGG